MNPKRKRIRSQLRPDSAPETETLSLDLLKIDGPRPVDIHAWETELNWDGFVDEKSYLLRAQEDFYERQIAVPNIYTTPEGTLFWIGGESGHYLTEDEAARWEIDGEELDRKIAQGISVWSDEKLAQVCAEARRSRSAATAAAAVLSNPAKLRDHEKTKSPSGHSQDDVNPCSRW